MKGYVAGALLWQAARAQFLLLNTPTLTSSEPVIPPGTDDIVLPEATLATLSSDLPSMSSAVRGFAVVTGPIVEPPQPDSTTLAGLNDGFGAADVADGSVITTVGGADGAVDSALPVTDGTDDSDASPIFNPDDNFPTAPFGPPSPPVLTAHVIGPIPTPMPPNPDDDTLSDPNDNTLPDPNDNTLPDPNDNTLPDPNDNTLPDPNGGVVPNTNDPTSLTSNGVLLQGIDNPASQSLQDSTAGQPVEGISAPDGTPLQAPTGGGISQQAFPYDPNDPNDPNDPYDPNNPIQAPTGGDLSAQLNPYDPNIYELPPYDPFTGANDGPYVPQKPPIGPSGYDGEDNSQYDAEGFSGGGSHGGSHGGGGPHRGQTTDAYLPYGTGDSEDTTEYDGEDYGNGPQGQSKGSGKKPTKGNGPDHSGHESEEECPEWCLEDDSSSSPERSSEGHSSIGKPTGDWSSSTASAEHPKETGGKKKHKKKKTKKTKKTSKNAHRIAVSVDDNVVYTSDYKREVSDDVPSSGGFTGFKWPSKKTAATLASGDDSESSAAKSQDEAPAASGSSANFDKEISDQLQKGSNGERVQPADETAETSADSGSGSSAPASGSTSSASAKGSASSASASGSDSSSDSGDGVSGSALPDWLSDLQKPKGSGAPESSKAESSAKPTGSKESSGSEQDGGSKSTKKKSKGKCPKSCKNKGGKPSSTGGFGGKPSETGGSGSKPSEAGGFGGKPSETEASGKPSETGGFGGKPSETEASGKPSETGGFGDKPSETEAGGKPSETEAGGKPNETEAGGKSSETEAGGKPTKASGGEGEKPSDGAPEGAAPSSSADDSKPAITTAPNFAAPITLVTLASPKPDEAPASEGPPAGAAPTKKPGFPAGDVSSGDTFTGSTLAGVCPKQCNPFNPAENLCDSASSGCTTAGGSKYYCACRAGYKLNDGANKDFSKQFKVPGQPYVYVWPGAKCDKQCEDGLCNEVLVRNQCV
ncbi:hypothetical protein P171DRAFT_470427 [Karstenula rhodostoma CBS 690.94]|uniref:EGF-like domain-containing protein n=1 Tax=Karstenula rhodostoma CBS 690.94 TaxID=1392251 RepID=A0A9P4PP70_9PLEO|nr:hypothetical protein P171DRAFT_470427 [Karstenula rhodostoma CBS 690.94]